MLLNCLSMFKCCERSFCREFSGGALYYALLIVFSFNSVDKIELGSKSNLS